MKPIKVWIARDKDYGNDTHVFWKCKPQDVFFYDNTITRWESDGYFLPLPYSFGLRPGQCQQFEIRKVKEKRK